MTARIGRDRERRALPAPRCREPRASSRASASTTGPRRSRAACAADRRSRWSAPATPRARRRLSGEPGREGVDDRARAAASKRRCRAILSSASRICRTSRCPVQTEIAALRRGGRRARRDPLATRQRRRGDRATDAPPVPVHRRRAEHRLARRTRRRRSTARASFAPERSPAATGGRSRRTVAACSRSATCARARSSASPPPSARARRWSRRSTRFSPISESPPPHPPRTEEASSNGRDLGAEGASEARLIDVRLGRAGRTQRLERGCGRRVRFTRRSSPRLWPSDFRLAPRSSWAPLGSPVTAWCVTSNWRKSCTRPALSLHK